MDEEGVVYIEDLTDYISPRAIRGKNEGPIVGEIKRGIQDREWMSDEGEAILKSRESKRWLKQKINSLLGYLEDSEDEKTEENQGGSTAGEALNIDTTRTNWFYGTVVGTVGWFLFVIVTGFSASSALSGLFFFISWPILPISLMMDARKTNFITHHRKRLLYYLIGALVPVIALFSGAAYLYRREYTL